MKILIVDDSRSSRLMVKTCLKELSCEIEEADSGESAVDRYKTGGIDLVIMDIHMPKMDGYEATRRMRAIEAAAKSAPKPIIALTAMDPAQAAVKTKAAGVTTCLSKPVKQTVLVEAIRAITGESSPAAAEPQKESAGRLGRLFGRKESDGLEQDGLREMRPDFPAEKQRELQMATLAIDGGDLETVRILAHRLKGEGADFGFREVSDFGAALAAAIDARDLKAARTAIQKLQVYLIKVSAQAA